MSKRSILPIHGEVAAALAADGGGVPQALRTVADPLHHAAARHGPPPHEWGGFTDAATRLAGQAGVLFGWLPDTFWAATPAELAALIVALSGDVADAPVDLAALMERFPDE